MTTGAPAIVAAITCLLVLGGCAGLRPPAEQLSAAEISVRKADDSQASQHAPLELVKAREKLEKARLATGAGNYAEARRLAEQAAVDAQLAEQKARTAHAKRTAAEMARSVEALRSETERYGTDR